jgi:hypothetical protein
MFKLFVTIFLKLKDRAGTDSSKLVKLFETKNFKLDVRDGTDLTKNLKLLGKK